MNKFRGVKCSSTSIKSAHIRKWNVPRKVACSLYYGRTRRNNDAYMVCCNARTATNWSWSETWNPIVPFTVTLVERHVPIARFRCEFVILNNTLKAVRILSFHAQQKSMAVTSLLDAPLWTNIHGPVHWQGSSHFCKNKMSVWALMKLP